MKILIKTTDILFGYENCRLGMCYTAMILSDMCTDCWESKYEINN